MSHTHVPKGRLQLETFGYLAATVTETLATFESADSLETMELISSAI